MKIFCVVLLVLSVIFISGHCQTKLASGQQPQVTLDSKGIVRLIYGEKNTIYYTSSADNGVTFSKPVVVGEFDEMHLGMTRGPQLATSKDYSIVAAMDKRGNIHSFRLTHKTNQWTKIQNVNDVEGSAPEGLMSITSDANNVFYAVWLDLRDNRNNNICFSTLNDNSGWAKNTFAYKSPETHVCECCKPSIAVKGHNVSIMFRNWLKGSRDLYLVTSSDNGKGFTDAQKIGTGTWQLKGCPMDGGGLSVGDDNSIHTAWQRDGQVFYARPGKLEEKIGEGRGVGMIGKLVYWENGTNLIVKELDGEQQKIGEGTALQAIKLNDHSIFGVWEQDGTLHYKTLSSE